MEHHLLGAKGPLTHTSGTSWGCHEEETTDNRRFGNPEEPGPGSQGQGEAIVAIAAVRTPIVWCYGALGCGISTLFRV